MGHYRTNVAAVRDLVRETEVHRDVYVDQEVFDLEMEHLFANAWIYVGHDSQVPNAGDYYGTTIGKQPVLMVRHTDGEVYVLYNRCPHKGTRITIDTCGNAGKFFRCPYHAWSFKTDGSLLAIPLRKGYEYTGLEQSQHAGLANARSRARDERYFAGERRRRAALLQLRLLEVPVFDIERVPLVERAPGAERFGAQDDVDGVLIELFDDGGIARRAASRCEAKRRIEHHAWRGIEHRLLFLRLRAMALEIFAVLTRIGGDVTPEHRKRLRPDDVIRGCGSLLG